MSIFILIVVIIKLYWNIHVKKNSQFTNLVKYLILEFFVCLSFILTQYHHSLSFLQLGLQTRLLKRNYSQKLQTLSVEDYSNAWDKREDVELETLSEWVISIMYWIKRRLHQLKHCVINWPLSVFRYTEAEKCLSLIPEKYGVVLANKASNYIVFVCKSYYYKSVLS